MTFDKAHLIDYADGKHIGEFAMNKNHFTVGQVSKITGIPKDTLRYYDKIGLFQPAIKSEVNGYRYYSIEQFWYIDMITCFRKLGLSIERIKKTLSYRDNGHVVNILNEQREEAARMRDYYSGVVTDIDWYCEQSRRIAAYQHSGEVRVEWLPQREVIYGTNPSAEQAYHIRLQENCREEILHADSIKRSYGYFLYPEDLPRNQFHIHGEYISIGTGKYTYTDSAHLMVIPSGVYACFITNVCGNSADFSPLIQWLEQNHMTTDFVVADEIGLQLFYYNQYNYPCEIKALLHRSDEWHPANTASLDA